MSDPQATAGSYDNPAEFKTPQQEVMRWLMELELADKAEKEYRQRAQATLDRYRGDDRSYDREGKRSGSTFNILNTNTETLAGAIYNNPPSPDVRRRFRDKDPLGKAVSEVLERSLSYFSDTDEYGMDECLTRAVKDYLLPGRAIVRVRYSASTDDGKVADERVFCENWQWDDFRRGPGKTWGQVPWIAYRHKMGREDLIEKFGEELGAKVPLNKDALSDTEKQAQRDDTKQDLFKYCEVWEFWDKEEKDVIWVCDAYRGGPLLVEDDPLELSGFFDIAPPLYSVETNDTLIPVPEYMLYQDQANELDKVTVRINKLVGMMKVRGVYDSTLKELETLLDKSDGEMVPADNVAVLYAQGGSIEKALWMMPIETIAQVWKELIAQREALKQVIYEITGIADIMRGATDARETMGAQQLKSQWGTLRIQVRQKKVQKFAAKLFRLMAEVICKRFQVNTLKEVTDLQFLTQQEMSLAMMVSQQGQVPPDIEEAMNRPTWEDIIGVMRSPRMTSYKVDIETDSTIAGDVQQDQQNITELLGGITSFMTAVAPAVQSGVFPLATAKTMLLAAVRRFKLGDEVEESIEEISDQPPPQAQQPDPAVVKAQMDAQAKQAELAQRDKEHTEELQAKVGIEQMHNATAQQELQLKAQIEQMRAEFDASLQAQQQRHEQEIESVNGHIALLKIAAEEARTRAASQQETVQ